MTWTVDDEREYQTLLRQKKLREQQARGETTLANARASQSPQRSPSEDEQKAGFSLTRMIGGAAQDVWNNSLDMVKWVGDRKNDVFGAISGGRLDTRTYLTKQQQADSREFGKVDIVEESTNPWENTGRALTGFLVPYAGAGKAFGAFRAGIGFTSAAARSLGAATAVNLTVMDATENNLANMLRDDFGFDNDLLDSLATEEDDDLMVGRVKAAISNLPLDLAGEAVVEGAIKAARLYKGVRANNQASKDALEVAKQDITVSREAARKAAEANPENAVKVEQPEATEASAVAEGRTVSVASGEVVVKRSQVKERPVTSLEEFVSEIQTRVSGVADASQLNRIADALITDPHEALTMLKIDPAKLDYSVFTDPAAIKAMQNSLGDLVDDIAKKTGRTGTVVSNKETLKAARLLAAQPNQIKKLVSDTQGLASRLTAARIMVGSHAHKLLEASTAAAAEIKAGGAGKAYADFIATLEQHGYLLGVLRGAGSEVGRALQSLQMSVDVSKAYKSLSQGAAEAAQKAEALKATRLANLAKGREARAAADATVKVDVTSDAAISFLKEVAEGRIDLDALEAIAKASGVNADRAAKELGLKLSELKNAKKASEAYEALFKDLQTDAGRLRLMEQLHGVKGDLSKLSRIMKRRERTGWLSKVDEGLKDTTGALFSTATAIFNVTGAGSMMLLKGISHSLAYAGLSGKALLRGNQEAAIAARKQAMKAWATFHAPTQAFGTAFGRAWAELKGAGLEELSFIADGLKLEKAAKDMQAAANDARRGTDRMFLKEDFASARGFSVQPETLNRISEDIAKYPIGRLGQMGLEWFIRAGAAGVNTTGALFRTGTSLFINAPDQFSGAFATRVGQHTAAVDIAAKEAAEAGLDGDALLSYIKGRSIELGDMIDDGTIGDDAFADGMRDMLDKAGVDLAREFNFSDDLDSQSLNRASSFFANLPIAGTLIMPFPKTPLRVMERSIMDYTPLYAIKKATREAWASGDAEVRGEIAARMTLVTAMLSTAWALTADDTVIGIDGGWRSTARRERGSYSIRIGEDTYEYNRIDPLGTVLGIVADVRDIMEEGLDNRELVKLVDGDDAYHRELGWDIMEAVGWGLFKNILSKSYLDSLEQLNSMSAARSTEEFSSIAQSWAASLGTRAVPLSGLQRQAEKFSDPEMRVARGIIDGMIKSTIGADTLPPRRDPIFGRPVEYKAGERLVGMKGGPTKLDPINQELARLSFDIQPPRWKQKGVELTADQMDRFLQLRGHTVEVDGMTLEDTITAFIEDPRYTSLTDEAKVEGIKKMISPFTREAGKQLIREDDDFAFKVLVQEVSDDFKLSGRDRREIKPEAERLAKELGINRSK